MRAVDLRIRRVLPVALALAALVPAVSDAAPAPIVVPCDGESGGVEGLRAAITRANGEGGGTIELARGCTYSLASVDNRTASGANGLPVIRSTITITLERVVPFVGIGVGEQENRPTEIVRRGSTPFRLLEVAKSGRLSISHVDLRGGAAPTGGTIRNNGRELRLSYSTVSETVATGPVAQGGAIWSASLVQLSYSDVVAASAVGRAAQGGGIWSGGGVDLSYSSVSRSVARASDGAAAGGGIYSRGQVDLSYSDVMRNTVSSARRSAQGGGVFGPTGVDLSYSGVRGNVAAGHPAAGGGIYSPRVGIDRSYSAVEGNRPDDCDC